MNREIKDTDYGRSEKTPVPENFYSDVKKHLTKLFGRLYIFIYKEITVFPKRV